MEKQIKPHYILILISTLKFAGVLFLFLIGATLFSSTKMFTFLNLSKTFILATVIYYCYLMIFWKGVLITLNSSEIDFKMTFGRTTHFSIPYSTIGEVKIANNFLYNIFKVSKVNVIVKNQEKTYGDNQTVLNHYLVLKNHEANEVYNIINKQL